MKAFAVAIFLASGCLLGLSAPAMAQVPEHPKDASADKTAAPSDTAAVDNPEVLSEDVLTPEARIRLLVKCSGPPPRPVEAKATPKPAPATAISGKAETPAG